MSVRSLLTGRLASYWNHNIRIGMNALTRAVNVHVHTGASVRRCLPGTQQRLGSCASQRGIYSTVRDSIASIMAAEPATLQGREDLYGGYIVEDDSCPDDAAEFSAALSTSLEVRPPPGRFHSGHPAGSTDGSGVHSTASATRTESRKQSGGAQALCK